MLRWSANEGTSGSIVEWAVIIVWIYKAAERMGRKLRSKHHSALLACALKLFFVCFFLFSLVYFHKKLFVAITEGGTMKIFSSISLTNTGTV